MSKTHSFVVLAYKESPFLEDCILSLLAQEKKSEIVLCSSTPNSFIESIAKKYNLKLHINKRSTGLASDWNFACQIAKTDYFTLAHQDDIYLPDYSKTMLADIDKNEDFLIKFSDYQELYFNKGKFEPRTWTINLLIKRIILFFNFGLSDIIKSHRQKLSFLSFGSAIPCPSVMYNKKRLKNFTFSQNFKINVDWIAWLNLANRPGAFLRSKKILMQHRIHQDSETSKGILNNVRSNEDLICFLKFWPKPLAKVLTYIFSLSYMTNK